MEGKRTIGVLDPEDDSLAYIVSVIVSLDPNDSFRPLYPVTCNINGFKLKFHRFNPKTNNCIYKLEVSSD